MPENVYKRLGWDGLNALHREMFGGTNIMGGPGHTEGEPYTIEIPKDLPEEKIVELEKRVSDALNK